MTPLDVWLDDVLIGKLDRHRRATRFTYTEAALALGVGRPLASVSMPVQRGSYTGDVVDACFDGLLPEGDALKTIAFDYNLRSEDAIGLLERLGRDVAGAM